MVTHGLAVVAGVILAVVYPKVYAWGANLVAKAKAAKVLTGK